jgi:hypothetical protein
VPLKESESGGDRGPNVPAVLADQRESLLSLKESEGATDDRGVYWDASESDGENFGPSLPRLPLSCKSSRDMDRTNWEVISRCGSGAPLFPAGGVSGDDGGDGVDEKG